MPTDPIVEAIATLIRMSQWDSGSWGAFLGCDPSEVEKWCVGEAVPTDHQMTTMLEELEYKKGSAGMPEVPAALDHFWEVITTWENDPSTSSILYPLRDGERVVDRVIRFTNDEAIENLVQNMQLIPPRRRTAFFEAAVVLFNEYTDFNAAIARNSEFTNDEFTDD